MRYAAFLRGINVGGNTKIDMAELRKLFETLGFENVKSYINSGNVMFDAKKTANEKLAARIEKAVESAFAKNIAVMVRSIAEIEELLGRNPFEDRQIDGQEIFVVFLANELSTEHEKLLIGKNSPNETFAVNGPNVFCLMDRGFADSSLGKKFIDNKLKTPATARNLRTVKKIAAM
jgi:uncharacterized protein (DUF1697 family)